ncbi:hypothetical protein JTE90_017630 [Oedothorax gibbosus]|uniref:Uncharacterized protein n=1 Tax=Oedothorax gibbosus TaxID=931172 RepID=A0AAV6U428_9ARAC|nr:hypothetical protein JTE90_017630 [Oedothorax gibbosus]
MSEKQRRDPRQQSSIKQNSRQGHFQIGQPSTSKANFCNNNVNEEFNREIAQAEDESIKLSWNLPVECDVDDFVEESVNGTTIRKKRVTKKAAAGDITSGAYENVKKYAMDKLKVKCVHCGVVRFAELKGRSVHSCCHSGQVKLPPLLGYPPELQDLLTSTSGDAQHFRQRITACNSSFAFATFGAHLEEVKEVHLL